MVAAYEDGRQSPDLQLLGRKPMFFTLAAVVQLVLSKLLLLCESSETSVETDRLRLLPPTRLHALVLNKQLTPPHTHTHTHLHVQSVNQLSKQPTNQSR